MIGIGTELGLNVVRRTAAVNPVVKVEPRETPLSRDSNPGEGRAQSSKRLLEGENPLDKAAEALGELLSDQFGRNKLRIDLDDEAGRVVYKAVDNDSGEVVRQFPPEEMLEILRFFRNSRGLVVDDNA